MEDGDGIFSVIKLLRCCIYFAIFYLSLAEGGTSWVLIRLVDLIYGKAMVWKE